MSTAPKTPPEAESTAGRPRIVLAPGAWRSAFLGGIGALLGILLAFGIDAWWDLRMDRQKEREYLDALRGELVATRRDLVDHMESRGEAVTVMQHYLEEVAAADPRTGSTDTVNVMLSQMLPYIEFAPRRSAFDDLISSGGVQLIQSDALRRALAAYEQAMALNRTVQSEAVAAWHTQMRPYLIEHASMPGYAVHMRQIPEDIRPAELPFRSDLDAFYGNRRYANLLMTQIFVEWRVRRRDHELLRRLDAVLELLDTDANPAGDR